MYYCVRGRKFTFPPVWHVRSTHSQTWHPCTTLPHERMTLPPGEKFLCVSDPGLALPVLGEHERDLEWRDAGDTLRWKYFADQIQPTMMGRRRRYPIPTIRDIALACYRRGWFDENELKIVLARLILMEEDA